ncbi:MAG: endonuclease NucS domain-containing protein, partial [bacterium]
MSLELGIWRIDGDTKRVVPARMDREDRLETILHGDVSILGLEVLVIGRQVITNFGKRIDLLAIDANGDLVIIELKRDRTPREVVAQLLDYASWVKGLDRVAIEAIWAQRSPIAFELAFRERFGTSPADINDSHRLVVVASELDASTERIVTYLSEGGIPINAVFFRCFQDDGREYLTRSWFVDPNEAEARAEKGAVGQMETWNGQDFYASIGDGEHRTWQD